MHMFMGTLERCFNVHAHAHIGTQFQCSCSGVDIIFTKFIYNQNSPPVTTQLDSLQKSSETLHICAFKNESNEWVFFPMVLPSSVAGYFKNLVSIFIFFILILVYFYVQGLFAQKAGCLCRLH